MVRYVLQMAVISLLIGCSSMARDTSRGTDQESPGPCIIPVKEPRICTQQYEPVCACDGRTFGNACTATAAGIQRFTPGQCDDQDTPDRRD